MSSYGSPVTEDETLEDLLPAVRRYVRSRLSDPHDADDVVQETAARLLAARARLDAPAGLGYALVVARNLVNDLHRGAVRERSQRHRLLDLRDPPEPDALVLAAEERVAVRAALERLPADQRAAMVAHDVHGIPLTAVDGRTDPATLAARLARARAKVRLDYLLALRRVTLPTARCRPVLAALSAGDRRRQGQLRAGAHLLGCDTCAALAPALVRRERALAVLLPWGWAGAGLAGLGWLAAAARRRPLQVGGAGMAVAATTALAVGVWPSGAPGPAAAAGAGATRVPAASAALEVAGRPLLPQRDRLGDVVGDPVTASGATVLAVPADEGFWVGRGDRRVWVALRGRGESALRVAPGMRVSFRGRVVAHQADFARRVGVRPAEGAAELIRQGHHVEVREGSVRLSD